MPVRSYPPSRHRVAKSAEVTGGLELVAALVTRPEMPDAMLKLADVTGNEKYSKLAQYFVGERGNAKSGRPRLICARVTAPSRIFRRANSRGLK